MPTVEESVQDSYSLGANLHVGTEAISSNQTITFKRYVRLVLPLDGFVFWVLDEIVSESALYNAAGFNKVRPNQPPRILPPAPATLVAKGSLHYATDTRQEETENYGLNRVVFTSEQEVEDLNEINPNVTWIAELDGIRFAFSSRGSFYRQAALYHYVGNAVYPDMETQVVDKAAGLSRALVVSNSLPAWLSLNNYRALYGFQMPQVTLYPSFLVPQNIPPPWASVHIPPESTIAVAGAATIDDQSSSIQLARERVILTTYGVRNSDAILLVNAVVQWAEDYGVVGVMNQPIIRDDKRTQSELGVIAMKKTVEFDVNYFQARMADVARQIIISAVPTYASN